MGPTRSETQYARSGDVHIAYQVVGDGPIDIVYVPGWISNVELCWNEPTYAEFLNRLASFSRLILFDKRGTGLSDRVTTDRLPTLEERMQDVQVVLDAVGSEKAAIFGVSEGGSLSAYFAASAPDRVSALILFATFAKRIWSPDYPGGQPLKSALWISKMSKTTGVKRWILAIMRPAWPMTTHSKEGYELIYAARPARARRWLCSR